MKKLRMVLKRYRLFLALLVCNAVLLAVRPRLGLESLRITRDNLLQMLSVLPPIFVLLGLLDVWVDRQTMVKFMGAGSGVRGAALAFLLGSAAAGPLYAAFPVAAMLMKKGARLRNVFIFLGAWSTTKIPMLLFEASSLGVRYMLLRLAFNLAGVLAIAFLLEKSLPADEQRQMYERAKTL